MPRGNDSQAALVDLQGQFAGAGGNAEELIKSSKLAITAELRAALLSPRNEEATKQLLEGDGIKQAQEDVDDGEVIDLAVRGHYVVAVVEVPSGRVFKDVFPAEDFGVDVNSVGARKLAGSPADLKDDERSEIEERMRTLAAAQIAAEKAEEAAREARAKAFEEQQKVNAAANDPKAEAKAEAAKAKGEDKK